MVNVTQDKIEQDVVFFLKERDRVYTQNVSKLWLFSDKAGLTFSELQKKRFAQVFYHIRGHFHDFLWYLLNFAPNAKTKKLILDNINEEAGEDRLSHEQLYGRFAAPLGVDIHDEFINKTHSLPFVTKFNHAHLQWLNQHDWPHRLSAYSAYERLDNIDYQSLLALAKRMGIPKEGLTFFEVHAKVTHFEPTLASICDIWRNDPTAVKKAFHFIYQTQLTVWTDLSNWLLLKSTPLDATG